MSTLERRQEEKEQRRNEIIDAAERVFARKGMEKATMSDIAKEARLSRGLIYFYFKDKLDLDLAITHRSLQVLLKGFQKAVARNGKGIDQIEGIGRSYVHFYRTQPYYFEQMMRFEAKEAEVEQEPAANELACLGVSSQIMSVMVQAVQNGIDDGSIRADIGDPLMTAVSLWGFTHGVIQIAANRGNMLSHRFGLDTEALIENVFILARGALAPRV